MNVCIVHLSPYNPKPNLAERFWDMVKDRIYNRRWPDLDEWIDAIILTCADYWISPENA